MEFKTDRNINESLVGIAKHNISSWFKGDLESVLLVPGSTPDFCIWHSGDRWGHSEISGRVTEFVDGSHLDCRKKRIRQVRDALNKCPDQSKICVIAEILGVGDASCLPAVLVGETKRIIESFPGATAGIKVGNVVRAYLKYKNAYHESSDEIIRLSRLLLNAGVQFDSGHPDSMKLSMASKAPAEMREDLLNG